MCVRKGLMPPQNIIEQRYDARFEQPTVYEPNSHSNAYAHLGEPVITRKSPELIKSYAWGLVPHWATDEKQAKEIRKGTVNARIETLDTLPAFRDAEKFRCIIPVSHFYEHQWTDLNNPKCVKNVFKITKPGDEVFSLAGIYTRWINPADNQPWFTFATVMTDANDVMKFVHNRAHRMPVVLDRDEEKSWLEGYNKDEFRNRDHVLIVAQHVEKLGD